MSRQAGRGFPSLINGLALLSIVAVTAEAQGVYELRCRGGAQAFAIDRLDENTLALNFNASTRAAGTAGEGLESGTCSWLDRAVNEGEPRQIQFRVSGSDATSVAQNLNNPKYYWSFFVSNTNKGYFQASSHRAWSTVADAVTRPGSITSGDVTTRKPSTTTRDIVTRPGSITPGDVTTRKPSTTTGDIVTRPAAPPAAGGLAIDKQVLDEAKLLQFIRDLAVENVKSNSFTVSFVTLGPAKVEVRAGLLSNTFGLPGYAVVDVEGGMTSQMETAHRLPLRVVRVGFNSPGSLPPGGKLRLFIRARAEDGQVFDHQQDFVVPPRQ